MNFEEWYHWWTEDRLFIRSKNDASEAWNACKNEVLKILNNHTNIGENVINEIEKL